VTSNRPYLYFEPAYRVYYIVLCRRSHNGAGSIEKDSGKIMELGGREKGSFFVVDIVGKIDRLKDSIVLKSYINTLMEKGRVAVALNLSRVTYLDSGALNVFIYSHDILKKKGGQLVLIEPSEYVRDVLEVVGLTKVVKIYPAEGDFNRALKND
jgi:anti-anti-sigma factor